MGKKEQLNFDEREFQQSCKSFPLLWSDFFFGTDPYETNLPSPLVAKIKVWLRSEKKARTEEEIVESDRLYLFRRGLASHQSKLAPLYSFLGGTRISTFAAGPMVQNRSGHPNPKALVCKLAVPCSLEIGSNPLKSPSFQHHSLRKRKE